MIAPSIAAATNQGSHHPSNCSPCIHFFEKILLLAVIQQSLYFPKTLRTAKIGSREARYIHDHLTRYLWKKLALQPEPKGKISAVAQRKMVLILIHSEQFLGSPDRGVSKIAVGGNGVVTLLHFLYPICWNKPRIHRQGECNQ